MNAILEKRPHQTAGRPAGAPGTRSGNVAYLVNQYPLPSSTFIRREIEGLEQLGMTIFRYSIRQPKKKLFDPKDLLEASRTRIVLELGLARMLLACAQIACGRPLSFLETCVLTLRVGWKSDRGILCHLVYLLEACQLACWLAEDKISHLHAHYGTNSTTVAMLTHTLGGPPYSFTSHGPDEFDNPAALKLGEKVARSKFAIAISEYGRSQLYRWSHHRHWNKIHVIHCGLDHDFLHAPPVEHTGERRLLFIGRLAEQKGTQLLVDAANLLKEEGIDFELVLVGDGPLKPDLEKLIRQHGLDDTVILAGWKKDAEVRQEILRCRALVMASFAEGLPVVIMESLALRRPVVSTNVAGVAELVQPGVSGWLVPAGAVEPLAEKMREVLEMSIEELAEYGHRGALLVAKRHDAIIEAGKLADLIDGTNESLS